MKTSSSSPAFPIAAIVHAERGIVDALLADFAFELRQEGRRVRGLVQQVRGAGKAGTVLVDLADGVSYPLFQDLGPASAACAIDAGGIADASAALRRALFEGAALVDLVVVNRFGALEANGGGFADEMLALMAEGVPLLTVVADDYLLDWRSFTGRAGVELAPALDALRNWFAGVRRTAECA
ncbi:MAG: molybdenum ABC transporter ATP-binding protein [Candidatus Accumulibacter sp. 66-26]|nr:DUF2478 domain-containing protein [Accumulibacter sp.]OJW47640.1 MAG: molybdenum ABC transporter ATP-binding protein [Candidatus Accumulibacter sp. 66-26]